MEGKQVEMLDISDFTKSFRRIFGYDDETDMTLIEITEYRQNERYDIHKENIMKFLK